MKRTIEIRSAEGGADSQIFVGELAQAYVKLCSHKGWKSKIISSRSSDQGFYEIVLEVTGEDLSKLDFESGGHRIQRVPPTEKKGRIQTSTVTVAVIDLSIKNTNYSFNEKDFEVQWFSGSGKGGQHRNKHQNSCRLKHIETGFIESRQGRLRENNLREARDALKKRIIEYYEKISNSVLDKDRKNQVGSGMRGDKTVTIRFQDDTVINHLTDNTMTAKRYMKGFMYEIW